MQPACESSRPPIIGFSRYRSSLVLRIPGSVAGEGRGHNANSHTRILDKVLGRSVKCRAIEAGLYILWSDLLITA